MLQVCFSECVTATQLDLIVHVSEAIVLLEIITLTLDNIDEDLHLVKKVPFRQHLPEHQ